jgi:hypothetical protein
MKKLLDEGLTHYEITPLSEEKVKSILEELQAATEPDQKKDILMKLLVQVIDSRFLSRFNHLIFLVMLPKVN